MSQNKTDVWINDCKVELKKILPDTIQERPFLPEDGFYTDYLNARSAEEALMTMVAKLFSWLRIKPKKIAIGFIDERSFLCFELGLEIKNYA